MCDKNSDENSGQRNISDLSDGSLKTSKDLDEEEDDDEDIDEEESDESEDEEVTENEENGGQSVAEESEQSDSEDTEVDNESDEEIENQALNGGISPRDKSDAQCYICLNRFSGQDIGSPDSCDDLHHFCLDCIEEWSKQINTCPVDRKIFTYIVVRREIGSTVVMKLPIVKDVVPDIDSVPEDVTYCEICGRCDREDRLLLCDGCDFGYHCECLSPPIENIPIEEWFCPDCYLRLFGPDTSTGIRRAGAGPSAMQRHRAIARTGASEAVRQRILQRRTQWTRKTVKRKTTRRKRKTTKRRKRRVKSRKTTSGTKTKRRTKRRTKKRKKRTKKSSFASRRLPADPRSRIASKLGIGPPPKSPFGLPSMKNVSNESVRKLIDSRTAAGISQLSLFGSELDVYDPRVQNFDEEEFITESVGGIGLMARSRISARLMASPVKRKAEIIQNLENNDLSNGSSIDLLSQIMSSQTILHSSSRDVRIARDGSLHLNRDNKSLPLRYCGNSGQSSPTHSPTSSSPARSPQSNSPQRTDNSSGAQNSSFNYSFGSTSENRTNSSDNNDDCNYSFTQDISAVKPVLNPRDEYRTSDESRVELYSDIESVGDNTRDNNSDTDGEEGKQLMITTEEPSVKQNINANKERTTEAIVSQSCDNTKDIKEGPKSENNLNKTKEVSDSLDNNNNNSSDVRTQSLDKSNDKPKIRKPSIKDLFGDSDDEEEDDTDIRRLLAEQGSINVHYPIKMSIVLKNTIVKKDTISDNISANKTSEQKSDENSSSAQSMEYESAPDLNKWIAVHPKDGKPVPDSTTLTTKSTPKWKSIESTDDKKVVTNVEPISVETNESSDKWKPIESMNVSQQLSPPEVDELKEKVENLTTSEAIDVNMSESELKSIESQTVDSNVMPNEQMSSTCAEEEEGEIKDDEQKVRRCRHGRIRRDKTKDRDQRKDSSKNSRHRSRSSESKNADKTKDKEIGNKEIDCEVNSSDVNVVSNDSPEPSENVEFKEKTFERKDIELEDKDNNESVGWKKLSNSSKMRSYRDGKPKDEELLFREREVQKKLVKKSILNKLKAKESPKKQTEKHSSHESRHKSSDGRRQQFDELAPNEEPKRKHRSEIDKSDECRKHKRKSDESTSKHKRKVDESAAHSSRKSPADEYNTTQESKERHKRHHKSSRHKHRDNSGRKESSERLISVTERSHRSHRTSKHSHHSSKNKGNDTDVWATGAPQKILRDHSSYSDITPLDSKEIYAEGDRIVINVNFNREKAKKPLNTTTNEESNYGNKQSFDDSSEKRTSVNTEAKTHVSSKKDESIFWASPPPPNTSVSNSTQSTGQSTTTITKIDDDMSSNHSNRSMSSGSDRKVSETESKKETKPIEEIRFLPRSLHQSDIRPLELSSDNNERPLGPHTPEGDYNEDQFLPTPTQDESQSPLRSSLSSRSSPLSIRSSPMVTTNGSKDDVYDPEAPLQSPDSHQTKANNRRTEPKSPELIVSRNSSKRSPQMASRRQSSHEPKSRHSDTQRDQKSPLTTSNTHSVPVRSPFKTNAVPTQRQLSKPSPQKPNPTHHKSSSSLMPPPLAPTSRPSTASSIALTAATIASINPQNLAQLLQMAHALNAKRQASAQAQQQRSSGGRTSSTNSQNNSNNRDHNKDHNEVVDMDVESPSPPQQPMTAPQQPRVTSTTGSTTTDQVKTLWEQIIKTTQQPSKPGISGQKRVNTSANSGGPLKKGRTDTSVVPKDKHSGHPHRHQVISVASDNKKQLNQSGNKLDQLTVLDDVPSSAVEMAVKEKFIKKLNRQERVIEEVKLVLKPYYQKRTVTKDEYKEILRKSVPKICHSRSGEINPVKIKSLIDGYIKRFKHLRKKSLKLPKK